MFVPISASSSLKTAEKSPQYFSAVSTRARIDRFLNQHAPASLVFDFVKEVPSPDLPTHAALQVEHRRIPGLVSFNSDSKEAQNKKALYRSDIAIQRIFYQPLTDGNVLTEALKIDFDQLKAPGIPGDTTLKPNVMLRPDGQFIVQPQFAEMGVEEKSRPQLAKFLKTVQKWLPSALFSHFIRIEDDGSLLLLNRWQLNPTRYWVDKENRRLKPYHLEKLANGVIANILGKEPVGIIIGSSTGLAEKSLRKNAKERLLAAVDSIEQDGYALKLEPLAPPPLPINPAVFAKALPSKAPNPFAAAPDRPR